MRGETLASAALAALSLFVVSLQVRAQIGCYANATCGLADSRPIDVSSAMDCCLQKPFQPREYAPITDPTACQPCIVIGFTDETIEVDENSPTTYIHTIALELDVPDDDSLSSYGLNVIIELNQNLSNAKLDFDYRIRNLQNGQLNIVSSDQNLPDIEFRVLDDDEEGEGEQFVLEITKAQLTPPSSSGRPIDIIVSNSLTVMIVDDDAIRVEFLISEFTAEESDVHNTIALSVHNPVTVDTYFFVLALTYQEYEEQYDSLSSLYPGLPTYTLRDEYDSAELDDFQSGQIPFTIRANTTAPDPPIVITLIDDNTLEPVEEGFRLVLVVDESKTRRSLVSFDRARQLALFRIDDESDTITLGFWNTLQFHNGSNITKTLSLPLVIRNNGTTEITITLEFIEDVGTTADTGEDFRDFTSGQIVIYPPNNFAPQSTLDVDILVDDIFETDEKIVVGVGVNTLTPPENFKPNKTGPPPPASEVDLRRKLDSVTLHHSTTEIIIRGDGELFVNLTVPSVVREGDSFFPEVWVSQKVEATFRLSASNGTAISSMDFEFIPESVRSDATSEMLRSNSSVTITEDNLVEPSETFSIHLVLTAPMDYLPYVTINNPIEEITITDNNTAIIGFKPVSPVVEGNGVVVLTVAVIGDPLATGAEVVVSLSTMPGSAHDDSDFEPISAMDLVFSGAKQEIDVQIPIKNDTKFEEAEMFTAHLVLVRSNVNTTVNPSQANITIIDDDSVTVGFTADAYSVYENVGMVTLEVSVILGTLEEAVYVSFYTKELSLGNIATSEDYESQNGSLLFDSSHLVRNITINIHDDSFLEYDESFEVYLKSNDDRVSVDPLSSTVTIMNDDGVTIGFEQDTYTFDEDGGARSINVYLTGELAREVVVQVSSITGTATAGADYAINYPQFLTFSDMMKNASLALDIIDDPFLEDDETLSVLLMLLASSDHGVVHLTPYRTNITIIDTDSVTIGFAETNYSMLENVGKVELMIDVTSGQLERSVEVILRTYGHSTSGQIDGSAMDIVPISQQTLIFTNSSSKVVTVIIKKDKLLETNETFYAELSISPVEKGVVLNPSVAEIVILNDDEVVIGFDHVMYTVSEDSEYLEITFGIQNDTQLSSTMEITVLFQAEGKSAMNINDFDCGSPTTFTFTATNTQFSVLCAIKNDSISENVEVFIASITSSEDMSDVILFPHTTRVEITDVDRVTFSFDRPVYRAMEGEGNTTLTIMKNGASDYARSVTLTGLIPIRIHFPQLLTFSREETMKEVSIPLMDDEVALEEKEEYTLSLNIPANHLGVELGQFPVAVLEVVDDDVLRLMLHAPAIVLENVTSFPITVVADRDIATPVTVSVFTVANTTDGLAQEGEDYVGFHRNVTLIPGLPLTTEITAVVIDDNRMEQLYESFAIGMELAEVPPYGTVTLVNNMAYVAIQDDDDEQPRVCTLSDSLVLYTFSNQMEKGYNFSISEGCERKLVTTCDEDIADLEIRVDFFQDDFHSAKVAIMYEGEKIIIDENLSLQLPASAPFNGITYQSGMGRASVSIPTLGLTVTRNLSSLTISFNESSYLTAGLCGDLNGTLLTPDCSSTVDVGTGLDSFKQDYKVKPSDLIIREARRQCGITANDTVIGDPLMTVPINVPGYPSDLHLCYEIHGEDGQYFNLVSDECTSVNAHYAQAPGADFLNIIDSMSFVVVDNDHDCHNIGVDVAGCLATVDGRVVQPLAKKRSTTSLVYEKGGISVRAYTSRVRISAPNCADNSLVMWVMCQHQSIEDTMSGTEVGPVDMIKFEITRGLNLKETSHGLIGQFWNVPVVVTNYTGVIESPDDSDAFSYHTVTISHPSSNPRSFTGVMHDVSWEFESKECLYVGDRQGGPIGEVDDANDSVIQGSYRDYRTDGPFATNYTYAVFDDDLCTNF